MLFQNNVTIANIARVSGADRYGQPKRKVIATELLANFMPNNSVTRNADGSFSQINGVLHITTELKPQDKITFQNGDVYYIYTIDHNVTTVGTTDYYTCRLVKVLP